MDRRDFIKLFSIAGFGMFALPFGLREAWGGSPRLYIMLNAGGGWDTTMACDPKGGNVTAGTGINPEFGKDEIPNAGNIKYAPIGNNAAFFQRFHKQLLVINGIDTQTNGHDTGTRSSGAGDLKNGFPAFAALVAAVLGEGQPMGFITNGGYDETAGTVGATRFGDLNAIREVIHTNRINAADDNSPLYHTEKTFDLIKKARQERLGRLRSAQHLPRIHGAQNLLFKSRLGGGNLASILEYLPDDLGNGLQLQANVGLAAYKAGLTSSINMSVGGFDSHSQNFTRQVQRLTLLFDGVGFLMDRAEQLDIADEIFLVICSEFGRTPNINDGNGKDHYAVGSMMIMGPGVAGNRVVGATTDEQKYMKIDPVTLQPSETGVVLRNHHIHTALREHAGIADHKLVAPYQLKTTEPLPLFG